MAQGRVRYLFPGGNTSRGFYSFYDHVIPFDANRILILKGGPGVGKSTFMRSIGETMLAAGFDAEYHCCSSDNGSLDGVVIPALGVAMIDGTAPHVVDPRNPGTVDEIINLGEYWDEAGMRKNKETILRLNQEVGHLFRRAYGYLAQAQLLRDEIESYYSDAMAIDWAGYNSAIHTLLNKLFHAARDQGQSPTERRLFASAITPGGLINHLDNLFSSSGRRLVIGNGPKVLRVKLVRRVMERAQELSFNLEAFFCSLTPELPEHLLIPGMDLAVVSSCEEHACSPRENDFLFCPINHVIESRLAPYKEDLSLANTAFKNALARAVSFIARAKATHDDMENYYIPNMRFDLINAKREETLSRILAYANRDPFFSPSPGHNAG